MSKKKKERKSTTDEVSKAQKFVVSKKLQRWLVVSLCLVLASYFAYKQHAVRVLICKTTTKLFSTRAFCIDVHIPFTRVDWGKVRAAKARKGE